MTSTETTPSSMTPKDAPSKREILALLVRERSNPGPYYRALAARTIADLPLDVAGERVLDLGSGTGHNAAALRAAGASVVGLDLAPKGTEGVATVRGSALHLPFGPSTFDGVLSSNMLEHTPDPAMVLTELEHVLAPGGWAWISFTNWYSPWGGHNITPLHYLGPERGLRAWTKLFGPPPDNIPGIGLFPTHIGAIFELVESWPTFTVEDAYPRYYPSQRWLLRVPVVREVLTWNCVLVLRRS